MIDHIDKNAHTARTKLKYVVKHATASRFPHHSFVQCLLVISKYCNIVPLSNYPLYVNHPVPLLRDLRLQVLRLGTRMYPDTMIADSRYQSISLSLPIFMAIFQPGG